MFERTVANPKIFTLHEAEQTMPLVRQIVRDIVDRYREICKKQAEISRVELESIRPFGREALVILGDLQAEIDRVRYLIDDGVWELHRLGIEFSDYEMGLINFPSRIAGEPAFLSWRIGEDRIKYWHRPDEGFAGRRSLYPTV